MVIYWNAGNLTSDYTTEKRKKKKKKTTVYCQSPLRKKEPSPLTLTNNC